MNKKQYLEKRTALLQEAQNLLNEGKIEEMQAKKAEIENLDKEFENISREQANLNALENTVKGIDFENETVREKNLSQKNISFETSKKAVDYENVFAKVALRRDLTNEEIAVYNQFNPTNAYTHSTTNTEILMPTTVVDGIQELMQELHPVLSEVSETTIKGIVEYTRHKAIVNGDAKYYAESEETEEEENTFDKVKLNGHELAKYVNLKWKLTQMAIEDLIPFLKREIGQRMAAAKANGILKGTGTDQPKGIIPYLTDTGTTQIVTSQLLKYEDFTAAMAKIGSDFKSGVKIYCNSNTLWNGIANLKNADGNPLFVESPITDVPGKIFGKFVYEEDALADGEILFGNVKLGWKMNKQEPMKLLAGDNIKKREHFFGGYEVNDGAVYAEKAFALIKATKINGLVG